MTNAEEVEVIMGVVVLNVGHLAVTVRMLVRETTLVMVVIDWLFPTVVVETCPKIRVDVVVSTVAAKQGLETTKVTFSKTVNVTSLKACF